MNLPGVLSGLPSMDTVKCNAIKSTWALEKKKEGELHICNNVQITAVM